MTSKEDASLIHALNQLITTLQNWNHEVKSYTARIDDGYARDARLNNKYKPQLDDLKQKVIQQVANLSKVLTSVAQLAKQLASCGHQMELEIQKLNDSLKSIQKPISDLESAIIKVRGGVHIAQELDSVFKPLQWLLSDFHCIPDKRPLKQDYLKLIRDISGMQLEPVLLCLIRNFMLRTDGSTGLAIEKSAEDALKALENKIFPVQTVSYTVKSALSVLQPLSASIPIQVKSYLSELESLASAQIGSKTYTYKYRCGNVTKVITIHSHFLDEDTAKRVLTLSQEMQNASSMQGSV